ncbi:MAG: serine/threonine-protein kinase [Polyangiaceae bacterium]
MQPDSGEIVAGKYRLTRLIGRGGMGTVWEGVHITLGTRVAVKFIDGTVAESPEALHRFENEARAAARLNSKYAVQVYDHGTTQDGRPFIVMEFLQGEPLDARLERENRIHPLETAKIIAQVCRALSRAHAAGIVHRDLKPENVFLVWDDEDQANVAKVVDFGIAKFTSNQLGVSSSTRTGSLLGTPYFMSPEQARGLRTVDHRTDLWSLGVIAFRCIVGRLPFEGVSVGDLLVKICTAPIPVPSQECPDCPAGFDSWFARAMQREPSDRFASAQELADQLLAVCGGACTSLASGILDGSEPALALRASGGTTPVGNRSRCDCPWHPRHDW